MKVDFMIIGAQKAATTLLAHQFRRHPKVEFCERKEPHFFSRREDWRAHLDSYHSLYNQTPGCLYGEASTTYSRFPLYPHVPEVLREYNPGLRFIYVVRDPIERMKSAYMHSFARGRVRMGMEEALLETSYFLNVSRYGVQIRRYLDCFPREQFLVLTFDEVVRTPAESWEKLSRHLDIPEPDPGDLDLTPRNATTQFRWTPHFPGKKAINRIVRRIPGLRRMRPPAFLFRSWSTRPELSPEAERALWVLLEEDVKFVEDYLGRPLSSWRKRYEEREAEPDAEESLPA